ncbi:hypothetical protein M231_02019 [Tremella mesenterica]|uniref:Uncharacterized protein n=1 Tax=Tremella mesenterica TaxID=5217 RepID=A0A4V1M4L3_TREME|nr:hypothetical protein M231_02019 [Tremella mesenterica]
MSHLDDDEPGTKPPSLTVPGYVLGTSPSALTSLPAPVNLFSKNSGPATPTSDANASSWRSRVLSYVLNTFSRKPTHLGEKSDIRSKTSTPDGQGAETAESVHPDTTNSSSPAPSEAMKEARLLADRNNLPSTKYGDRTPGAGDGSKYF